jgi:NAD(P)-dependent dehydrogenase (short-subunit alcohol dehydrogenase family)
MTNTLQDAVIVVTGGGTGVGQGLAVAAAARGAKIAIASPEPADESIDLVTAAGGTAQWFPMDIADHASVAAGAEHILSAFGEVNVLVNNAAGSSAPGLLQATDPSTVRRQFEINILGTYHCLRVFHEPLAAAAAAGRLAHVLNVGSEHSLGVPPHVPPISTYTVTKYTSLAFTDVLRRDFGEDGIGVTMLAPSWVLTDAVRGAMERIPAVAEAVGNRGQDPALVAGMAWDAVLDGRYLAITNDTSREFVRAHAQEILDALGS